MAATPSPPAPTFHAAYCAKFRCDPARFERRVLLQALYPHARLLALFISPHADCFAHDRALVTYCGRLTSRSAIEAELREYARSLDNTRVSRRVLRFRISGRRLQRLATEVL